MSQQRRVAVKTKDRYDIMSDELEVQGSCKVTMKTTKIDATCASLASSLNSEQQHRSLRLALNLATEPTARRWSWEDYLGQGPYFTSKNHEQLI